MSLRVELSDLKSSIDALLVTYPELAEDEILRADMFEAETALSDVLAKLVSEAQDAKMMAMAVKLHMDDLSARKARYKRREEAMRLLMQSLMDRADLRTVALPTATLTVAHRKPTPIVENGGLLPPECVQVVRMPDMATIRAWCEAGNIPDGVRMSNGSTSLMVRVK